MDFPLHTSLRDLALARSSLALVGLALLLTWETFAPFFASGSAQQRGIHGSRNLILGALNALMIAFAFAGLWYAVSRWATTHRFGLLNVLNLPLAFRLMAAFLLFDVWMYWWHRLNHRIPFLWRFHRTHHSDTTMDVTTASRFHFGEILFSACLRLPVILLLGLRIEELLLYEMALFAVVQLHHANISLPAKLDALLRSLIVTPNLHKVHHSRLPMETNSNYSSLFSFWDRCFRTFQLRADPRTITFGLAGFDEPAQQSLSGLIKTPLAHDRPGLTTDEQKIGIK
ncbi:MAG: Fatty acid hydroxylase [Pedosphaera sp.]|nr:Fatty acid hydroxylase [Pedosphaera sp.]